MPVAATGVQACEWRLVGVARQFEVYCVGLPRAETRAGIVCLFDGLKKKWVALWDLIFLSVICLLASF